MSETETYIYKDLSTLVRVLKLALVVSALIGLLSIWSSWMQIDLLQLADSSEGISEQAAEANDTRQQVIAIISIVAYLATMILFLRWVYLSNRNAHALGATHMEYTPGWSVGWFFVPFANFWQPYNALNETFQASHPEYTDNWHHADSPWILPVWWAFMVITLLMGRFTGRNTPDTLSGMIDATWTGIVEDGLNIGLRLATLLVVSTLFDWQTKKHEAVADAIETRTLAGEWPPP
jgi:hypothetical protein